MNDQVKAALITGFCTLIVGVLTTFFVTSNSNVITVNINGDRVIVNQEEYMTLLNDYNDLKIQKEDLEKEIISFQSITDNPQINQSTLSSESIGQKTLTAFFDNIRFVVDGELIIPKDDTGNEVEPFIVDGTTYLPVKTVGEAVGKQFTWDGNTSTVYLGAVPGQTQDWLDACSPYQYGGDLSSDNNKSR